MNITNTTECLEEWEREFMRTGNESLIPPEDYERVRHEQNELYNAIYDLLIFQGHTSETIQTRLDEMSKT